MDQLRGDPDVLRRHRFERQREKSADAPFELPVRRLERRLARRQRLDVRRIGDAPVRGGRTPRPHRAGFAGGARADGDDVIEARRVGRGEFVPRLASWRLASRQRHAVPRQRFQRDWMDLSRRTTAGGKRAHATGAEMIEQRLAENRTGGVAGAQHQDVERRARTHGDSLGMQRSG